MTKPKTHFYHDATLLAYCGRRGATTRFISKTTCRLCLELMSTLVAGQVERVGMAAREGQG